MVEYGELALKEAARYRGKIQVLPKVPIRSLKDFAVWYTPGVAALSRAVHEDGDLSFDAPRLVLKLRKGKTVYLLSTAEPARGAALVLGDYRFQFLSLGLEGDWSPDGAAAELSGTLLTGGKFDLSLTLMNPAALSGKMNLSCDGVPFSALSPFPAHFFPTVTLSGSPFRGELELSVQGGEPRTCRFSFSTPSLSARRRDGG